MFCPVCKSNDIKVVDKRDNDETNTIRRRRHCNQCKKRFTSYERIEKVIINVIKKDGKLEEFDRNKLKIGISRALKKRSIDESKVEELISSIEQYILNNDLKTIKSNEIGQMVLRRLTKLDKLSALLFAAVYKDFKTLEDVEKELDRLTNENE